MRVYEWTEGRGYKFWGVGRKGRTVTVRWGPPGAGKVKEWPDIASAKKAVEDAIRRKEREGFVPSSVPAELVLGVAQAKSVETKKKKSTKRTRVVDADPNRRVEAFAVGGAWQRLEFRLFEPEAGEVSEGPSVREIFAGKEARDVDTVVVDAFSSRKLLDAFLRELSGIKRRTRIKHLLIGGTEGTDASIVDNPARLLNEHYRQLESLTLRGSPIVLRQKLDLPKLKNLDLDSNEDVAPATLRALLATSKRAEGLRLSVGVYASASPYRIRDLAPFWDSRRVPRLRRLMLGGLTIDDVLARSICSGSAIERLEVLDLGDCRIDASGRTVLKAHAAELEHLILVRPRRRA